MLISLMESVIEKHSPFRQKRVKRQKQPEWMSENILEAIDTTDKFVKVKRSQ